jgi:hypothetical protein
VSFLRRRQPEAASARRILFPIVGSRISVPALDTTLRLARSEQATLMPVYLAIVPKQQSLESALPSQAEAALPVLELIDQRATRAGVPVDSRIERGRSPCHALSAAFEHERFDTLVVAARTPSTDGFVPADVAWVLDNAPGEVLVLRPDEAAAG